jgi:predicted glycosyltransferase
LLYSHDGLALGHCHRNLKIARHLVHENAGATALLITGAQYSLGSRLPPGVDYLKLPTVAGTSSGEFESRGLEVGREVMYEIRASLIKAAVEAFEPDLLIVDHLPTGAWGELLPTFERHESAGRRFQLVLGIRDVLDEPAETQRVWHAQGAHDAIERYYDHVMVYGDSALVATASRYAFPDAIAAKLTYCGYIGPGRPAPDRQQARSELNLGEAKLIVVTGGGGYDAATMMHRSLAALEHVQAAPHRMLLVAGPMMRGEDVVALRRSARGLAAEVVTETHDLLTLLAAADAVVGMCGYNTVTEALSLGQRMIVMPRNAVNALDALRLAAVRGTGDNRHEQGLRAEAFAARGLVDMIGADAGPKALAAAIDTAIRTAAGPLDTPRLDGLTNVNRVVADLLAGARAQGARRLRVAKSGPREPRPPMSVPVNGA